MSKPCVKCEKELTKQGKSPAQAKALASIIADNRVVRKKLRQAARKNRHSFRDNITVNKSLAATIQPVPKPDSSGWIKYGGLDEHKRPTGVEAIITLDMIGAGSEANPRILPPGFKGGGAGHARGHLLGNQLGGSGNEKRNLVTLMQNPTNTPEMSNVEWVIKNLVLNGETVYVKISPIYKECSEIPVGITILATGSRGSEIAISIMNKP